MNTLNETNKISDCKTERERDRERESKRETGKAK